MQFFCNSPHFRGVGVRQGNLHFAPSFLDLKWNPNAGSVSEIGREEDDMVRGQAPTAAETEEDR